MMANGKKKTMKFLIVLLVITIVVASVLIGVSAARKAQMRDMLVGKAFKGSYITGKDTSLETKETYVVIFTDEKYCYVYDCELLNGRCYDTNHDYFDVPYAIKGGLSDLKVDILGAPFKAEEPFMILIDASNKIELADIYYAGGSSLFLDEFEIKEEPERYPVKID